MAEKQSTQQLVHEVGGGRAAFNLHGPNWLAAGCDLNIIDADPSKLTPYRQGVQETMRQAYEDGRLTFKRLGELAVRPNIIDITTASGHHVQAIHQTLEELEARGVTGRDLTWLIEKPVTSSAEEAWQLVELLKSGQLDVRRTFVNEHYAASKVLARAREIINEEAARDNPVRMVDVVFNKNRIPDVEAGRFTDPNLRAYGIEMPHQLIIGYALAGATPMGVLPEIIENQHYEQALGVPHSQGNYTAIRTPGGVVIRMAQGLGPYRMSANGAMIPNGNQPIERYAEVIFGDKRSMKLEFSPIPEIPSSYNRLTWIDETNKIRRETIQDRILQRVLGGIAAFSATGVRPDFAKDFGVPKAIAYAATLNHLAHDGIK